MHYLSWAVLYSIVWFLFYFRKIVLKKLNTPRYPNDFRFNTLSIYWRWLLVYFYSDRNFLSNLPLHHSDIKDIFIFRKFVKFEFFSLINFNKIKFIEKNFTNLSFNHYKFIYLIFKRYAHQSIILNKFLGGGNILLKFVLIKQFVFKKNYRLFIYNNFYKSYMVFFYLSLAGDLPLKKLTYVDFFMFVCLNFFKVRNNCPNVNIRYKLDALTFNTIVGGGAASPQKNKNFFSADYLAVLKYFHMCKKYTNDILRSVYIKIWSNLLVRLNRKTSGLIIFKNFFKTNVVNYDVVFVNFLQNYWPIRLRNDTFTKFTDINSNRNGLLFFLRKAKIFNKSRYSRNRQIYRTGVYMCLYINIIFVYFYIFAFYRFAFNFGFMWVGLGLLIIAMVVGRASRYKFYNFKNLINEGFYFFNWCGFLVLNVATPAVRYFFTFFKMKKI